MIKASTLDLARTYTEFKADVLRLKRHIANIDAKLTELTLLEFLTAVSGVVVIKNRLNRYAGVAGFADYAKTIENDPSYDVVTALNTLVTLVDDWIKDIRRDWPRSGLHIQVKKWDLTKLVAEDINLPAEFIPKVRAKVQPILDFIE